MTDDTVISINSVNDILSNELRQYCCPYENSVFFYANNQAYECDYSGKILNINECCISTPNQYSSDDDNYHNSNEDKPQFFTTYQYQFNGCTRFLSSMFNEIIDFDHSRVRKVKAIPSFKQDIMFNKVAVVQNKIFVNNGSQLYELLIGQNFIQDAADCSFSLIWDFTHQDIDTLRIYNIFDQLIIRDTQSGQFWMLGVENQIVPQPQIAVDFNLSICTPNFILGENLDDGNAQIITIENNHVEVITFETFSAPDFEISVYGVQPTKQYVEELLSKTSEEIIAHYSAEKEKVWNQIRQSNLIPQYKSNTLYVEDSILFTGIICQTQTKFSSIPSWANYFIMKYCDKSYIEQIATYINGLSSQQALKCLEIGVNYESLRNAVDEPSDTERYKIFKKHQLEKPEFRRALAALYTIPSRIIERELQEQATVYLTQENIMYQDYKQQIKIFRLAIQRNNLELVNVMMNVLPPAKVGSKHSPLVQALKTQNQDLITLLLPYQKAHRTMSILCRCIRLNFEDGIVKFMHQSGMRTKRGQTALMMAVNENISLTLIKKLAEKEVGVADNRGYTALMRAMDSNHWHMFDTLKGEAGFIITDPEEYRCGWFAFLFAQCSSAPMWIQNQLFEREKWIIFAKRETMIEQQQMDPLFLVKKDKTRGLTVKQRLAGEQSPYFKNVWDFYSDQKKVAELPFNEYSDPYDEYDE